MIFTTLKGYSHGGSYIDRQNAVFERIGIFTTQKIGQAKVRSHVPAQFIVESIEGNINEPNAVLRDDDLFPCIIFIQISTE